MYVLDLRTFAWRRPSVLAASPMGRHGALAAVLGGRVVMACGTWASGSLDSIVTMTADFGALLDTASVVYSSAHSQPLFGARV